MTTNLFVIRCWLKKIIFIIWKEEEKMLNFNFICFESRPSKEERKKEEKKSENFGFKIRVHCSPVLWCLLLTFSELKIIFLFLSFLANPQWETKSVRPTKLCWIRPPNKDCSYIFLFLLYFRVTFLKPRIVFPTF